MKDRGRIQAALANRAQDAGEDFIRVGAPERAIAAADFARDDGGPERMLGAPVKCRASIVGSSKNVKRPGPS